MITMMVLLTNVKFTLVLLNVKTNGEKPTAQQLNLSIVNVHTKSQIVNLLGIVTDLL